MAEMMRLEQLGHRDEGSRLAINESTTAVAATREFIALNALSPCKGPSPSAALSNSAFNRLSSSDTLSRASAMQ